MKNRVLHPGDRVKHFKGGIYQIIAVAEHSETGEAYVVYQALYDDFKCYVRPYDMFMEEVDRDKYPEVKEQYRFTHTDEPEQYEGVNPYLMRFLETDSSADKAEFLVKNRNVIDERLLSDISVSLDITADEGTLDERIDAVINCLNTMSKYECGRLR